MPPRADAIVVLGCPPSLRLMRRVERGIRLWREEKAPLLVLSGGGRGPVPEAEIMRRAALGAGVPPAALLVEPKSRDTLGNSCETARLLRAHRLGSVVLVSDRTHLLRAALLFRLAGVAVVGWSGVRPHSRAAEIGAALHELTALPWSVARALWRS
ncbi:MAG TPA: YdcF family protein [Stellaceae bacterium]|nr:YdcF family protein [Stellaceae bacterium]